MKTFLSRKLLCATIAVSFLAFSQHFTQAQSLASPRITQPVDESSLVTLKGSVHPLANAKNDAGPASPDLRVDRIQLRLKRSPEQESALEQLIINMHTPGSANYHKWLTPTQFGQQFGPADQDIQTIENWVQSHGFEVGKLNPGNGTLEISGTIGQLEDTFHTSIHKYVVAGQQHYANAVDPQIPSALAPVLGGFVSLNNFPVHRMSRTLGKASYNPQTHQATPQWTVSDNTSPLGYDLVVAPQDFYVQYDLNPLYAAGTNGSGQTIAIINDSNININLVNNFRTLFGLPSNPPQVIIDGNDPGIDGVNNVDGPDDDSIEAYLDVEWSGAVAPNATIDLVIGADTALEEGLILAAERAVYSDLAPVMSVSFGSCEEEMGTENAFINDLWEQAAAEGITVMIAAGDSGSAGCDDDDTEAAAEDGLAVSGFASTPYNVAVGGTDFYYSDYAQGSASAAVGGQLANYWNLTPNNTAVPTASLKSPAPEQPWNDSQFGLNIFSSGVSEIVAGSGGASSCEAGIANSDGEYVGCTGGYAKPSWQTGTGVPNDSVRDLPDISLFAADGMNNSFFPICADDGDCQSGATPVQITAVGGTSGSSPAFAGIMALVNQKYGPQGQADFVLYPLAAQHSTVFHDVTAGTNAVPCTIGSPNCGSNGELTGYAAGVGYDLASGLGSVDANQLITNWNSISFTATTTTLTPSSTSFTHGTAVTINTNVSASGGTPTGNVALVTDSPVMSNQGEATFPLSNGSASGSINYLPGGTYDIWGQYGGNGTYGSSISSKTQITVTPESSSLYYNVVAPENGGLEAVPSGSTIPYGTQLILDAEPVPSSYYTSCITTGSTSSTCENATFTAPTGSVSFTDKGAALNTAVLNSEGDAEYNSGSYAIGSHSIAASYSGDSSYSASTASAVTFTVTQGSASVSVTSNLNPIALGQTLVLTAIVESDGIGAAPTGTVTFYNGASILGSATTLSPSFDATDNATIGVATLTIPNLSFGSSTITAVYKGDTNYATATSSGYALSVSGASASQISTTTASASAATTSSTAAINVTATVTGQPGHPAPTGTIDFQTSGVDLGQITLPAVTTGYVTTVSLQVNSELLVQGTNLITLQYSGDGVYQPSSANLTINNPLSDFSMVAGTPVVTMTAGGTATDTLNLTSVNGFNGAVALTCTAPSGLTCSLNPASVTVNGSTTATLTLNAASTSAALGLQHRPGWLLASGGASLACLFLFGLPNRRRKWQTFLGLILVAVVTVAIGCGGGGGGSNSSGTTSTSGGTGSSGNNGNTASASYTVVVTGTQGTAVTHNVAISVKVQSS